MNYTQALELKLIYIYISITSISLPGQTLEPKVFPQVRAQTYTQAPGLPGRSTAPGTRSAGSGPLDAKLKREAGALQRTKEKAEFCFFPLLDLCQQQASERTLCWERTYSAG